MGAQQRKVGAQQASDRDRLTPTLLAIFTPVDIIIVIVIVIVIVVIVVIIIFIQCCLYSLLFSSPAEN